MKREFKKLNFGELIENNSVADYYAQVFNSETNRLIFKTPKTNGSFFKNHLVYIHDVPDYLKVDVLTNSKNIAFKKINSYQGSLINIKPFAAIDDYLAKEISSKERYEIRRRQKRLDTCIKPIYKMYYGKISRTDYDILFNEYKHMLLRRLEQKQSYWEELDYWNERYESSFKLINDKKACVFAIYHNHAPIAIYINSIYDKIIFNEVVAYDIDYARFNIGILIFIKLIEWSINNGMELMDMSKGDFSYKMRFRNGAYTFQNHLIYDATNPVLMLKANQILLKQKLIYTLLPWLKKLKINKLNTAFKRLKNRNVFKGYSNEVAIQIETKMLQSLDSKNDLEFIDHNKTNYRFLKKPIIDFAFLNVENVVDIMVYQDNTNKNTFYIKGKKAIQQVVKK